MKEKINGQDIQNALARPVTVAYYQQGKDHKVLSFIPADRVFKVFSTKTKELYETHSAHDANITYNEIEL